MSILEVRLARLSHARDRIHRLLSTLLAPLRSVWRGIVLALSGLDRDDLEAVTGVVVYLVLATVVVVWASSMYLLVRAITGV